ncbi:hypothetical protein, partial [Bacteroides heparinolyticus]|uniref:hypothetical protein n=1 Tax=Prevotella heparinolytica TaxID=28113 RepID=UPI0035A10B9D
TLCTSRFGIFRKGKTFTSWGTLLLALARYIDAARSAYRCSMVEIYPHQSRPADISRKGYFSTND